MKFFKLFCLCCTIFLICPSESPAEAYYRRLYQRGVYMLEAQADPSGALPIFLEITKRHFNDRLYAARSQFYLGVCYRRTGSEKATQAFQDVITKYPEQKEWVKSAEFALEKLPKSPSMNLRKPSEIMSSLVWQGNSVFGSGFLSQDGRLMCYVDRETGELILHDFLSGAFRRIVHKNGEVKNDGFAIYGVISPDSQYVAFAWQPLNSHCELWISEAQGLKQQVLFSEQGVIYARPVGWMPDSQKILVCLTRDDLTNQMIFVSVPDGKVIPVRDFGMQRPDHVSLSPDGSSVAYSLILKQGDRERDVFLCRLEDNVQKPLVSLPGDDRLLSWAPSGKSIHYLSNRSGTWDVYTLSIWHGFVRGTEKRLHGDVGLLYPLGITHRGDLYFEAAAASPLEANLESSPSNIRVLIGLVQEENQTLMVPDDIPDIQSAISAAEPGDLIYVRSGRYSERITIDKALTLLGENPLTTIIEGNGLDSVVRITASQVNLNSLSVTRGLIGVDIRSELPIQYVSLRDLIVTENQKDGILTRNTAGNHIIEDCRISQNGSYAVNAHQFSGSVIRNCRVFDNQNGLRFGWGWDIRIQDNFVYHNKNAGVYPDSCYSSTIERNLIYANGVGIEMGYIAGHNTLRENIILDNKQGIQIDLEGRDLNYNRFYYNAIVNNIVPVGDSPNNIARFQQWDNGFPNGGNYWSNYSGRDEDQDGIGDTPHQFLSNARDDYPLMKARTLIQAKVALVVEQWDSRDRQAKISAFISLPAGIPPHEIDVPTVVLNGTLHAEESTLINQDQEGIGSSSLNVSFDWTIPPSISLIDESIELSIFGYLKSSIAFTGSSFVNITER